MNTDIIIAASMIYVSCGVATGIGSYLFEYETGHTVNDCMFNSTTLIRIFLWPLFWFGRVIKFLMFCHGVIRVNGLKTALKMTLQKIRESLFD